METSHSESKINSTLNVISKIPKAILWILKKLFIHKKKCCQ